MVLVASLLVVLASGLASAQEAGTSEAFEVVSIKPSVPRDSGGRHYSGCSGGPGSSDPGRITCNGTTLGALIVTAYQINGNRLTGLRAPFPTFDIVAKVPPSSSWDQVDLMWRNLLVERFKLVAHRERVLMPSYVLELSNGGPKMKESEDSGAPDVGEDSIPTFARLDKDGFPVVLPGTSVISMKNNVARLSAARLSMEQFAADLERRLSVEMQVEQPVIDGTALKGKYDFRLMWIPGDVQSLDGPPLLSALESQLGLRLVQKKISVEILVVDHAERFPSEN